MLVIFILEIKYAIEHFYDEDENEDFLSSKYQSLNNIYKNLAFSNKIMIKNISLEAKINNLNLEKNNLTSKINFKNYISENYYSNNTTNSTNSEYKIHIKRFILIIPLIFIPTLIFCILIRYFYREKEKKLDIFVRLRGVSKAAYFLSWFLLYLIACSISIVIALILGFIYNLSFLFIFPLYIFNLYSFSYLFYILFFNAKKGYLVNYIINIISFIIGAALVFIKNTKNNLIFSAIFPNVNAFFSNGFVEKNYDTKEYNWHKIFCFIQLIFYLIINLLINKCFKDWSNNNKNYQINKNELNAKLISEKDNIINNYEIVHQELSMKEQQQKNENNYMKIIGLSKQINGFNIINNFNLELFPDDIFCLLGFNEKQKACLIEMILGLITPEDGDIFLNENLYSKIKI